MDSLSVLQAKGDAVNKAIFGLRLVLVRVPLRGDNVRAAMLAAPALAQARTVTTVYFEWDTTTLNAKALGDVWAAAPKAKACEYNGLRVVGHADTSHTAEQSTALGMARARAVRDALVAKGVADSAISVATHGELDLTKATADGVREPLNRRVEIVVVCD